MTSAKYKQEEALTERLVQSLALPPCAFTDPHANGGSECGVDVVIGVAGQRYGVQVTVPGDRAHEARLAAEAQKSNNGVYFMWTNANSHAAYKAYASAIERKAALAERYDFSPYDEAWLLMIAGIPTMPGIASTLLPPWFDAYELTKWTMKVLDRAKYDRVFILVLADTRPRVVQWTKQDMKWIELGQAAAPQA
jgi:hypothetical protein